MVGSTKLLRMCVCVCVSVVDWNSSSGDRFAFAPYSSPVLFDLPPPRSEVVVDFSTYTDRCSTRGGTAHSLLGQQHLHLVSSIFLLFFGFWQNRKGVALYTYSPHSPKEIANQLLLRRCVLVREGREKCHKSCMLPLELFEIGIYR